jgi:hypothetical protein
LLDTFLGANPVPANTDYYPYVDQHAEKAFFKKSSAKNIIDLRKIWLLTNPGQQRFVLESHTRRRGTRLAKNAFDGIFLQRLFKDNLRLDRYGDANIPVEPYQRAVSVSRVLYRCNPHIVEKSWLKDAFWLSEVTTIYGVPDLITPFWEVLIGSECFPRLPEHIQTVFRFFLAASQRNNLQIIREGQLLADHDFLIPGVNDYRVLHILAAYARLDLPRAATGFVTTLKQPGNLALENTVLASYLVGEARKMAVKSPPILVR